MKHKTLFYAKSKMFLKLIIKYNIKQIMTNSHLYKTTASTHQKVANLPRM